MSDTETRRLLNIQLTTNQGPGNQSVLAYFLYPTIYTFSCRLNIVHFPFDEQHCQLVFGSWTYETPDIDYQLLSAEVGTKNYISNEGWGLVNFTGVRNVIKYECCPHPYTNLKYTMVIRRKPLYYIVNLIFPTCIITMISLVGFFMPSNAKGERNEKISLGITTLLSMSILLLMVGDSMPTTSNYVPLIGRFYLAMIGLISTGTITTAFIIEVQKRGLRGKPMCKCVKYFFYVLSVLTRMRVPKRVSRTIFPKKAKTTEKIGKHESTDELKPAAPLVSPESVELTDRTAERFHSATKDVEKHQNGHVQSGKGGTPTNTHDVELPTKYEMWLSMEEYEWAASILERLALVGFLCALIVGTIGILTYGAIASGRMDSVFELFTLISGGQTSGGQMSL